MIVGVTSNNRKIPRWFWPGKFWGKERLKLPQGTVASQIIVVWNNNKMFKFWGRSTWSTLGWEAGGREGHAKFTPIPPLSSPASPFPYPSTSLQFHWRRKNIPLGPASMWRSLTEICATLQFFSFSFSSPSASPPSSASLSLHPSAFSFLLLEGQVSKRPGPKDANA